MHKNFLIITIVISGLMMLPACDWKSWMSHSCSSCSSQSCHDHGQNGDNNDACCISLEGKTAFTQTDFERKLDSLCQARPEIKQALQSIPADQQQAFYDQLAQAMLAELLVNRYVQEQGLTQTEDYKKAAQEAHAAVETQLMNSLFQSDLFKKIEKEITDDVAQKYYEENRDRAVIFKRQPFIEKAGGVQVQIIDGLSEAEAKKIDALAQKKGLNAAAKETQRKVKNLGLINGRSLEVDEHIRSLVMGKTTAPAIEAVKLTNGKHAVVEIVKIFPDTFKSFSDPEVKDAVRSFLMRNELGKAVGRTMDELKTKYNAVIHHDVIRKAVGAPIIDEQVVISEEK